MGEAMVRTWLAMLMAAAIGGVLFACSYSRPHDVVKPQPAKKVVSEVQCPGDVPVHPTMLAAAVTSMAETVDGLGNLAVVTSRHATVLDVALQSWLPVVRTDDGRVLP